MGSLYHFFSSQLTFSILYTYSGDGVFFCWQCSVVCCVRLPYGLADPQRSLLDGFPVTVTDLLQTSGFRFVTQFTPHAHTYVTTTLKVSLSRLVAP